jgi:hypothetical protein
VTEEQQMATLSSPRAIPQVLTEIRTHGGLKLSAVGKQFPAARGEGCVNPATVWRWAHEGAKTPTGERVKLEVVRVGMSWLTSQAALDRFVVALTSASTPSAGGRDIKIPNPSKRESRAARANKKLQEAGC